MERFLNYSRLIRTMAWVQWFIYNVRNKVDRIIDSRVKAGRRRMLKIFTTGIFC